MDTFLFHEVFDEHEQLFDISISLAAKAYAFKLN